MREQASRGRGSFCRDAQRGRPAPQTTIKASGGERPVPDVCLEIHVARATIRCTACAISIQAHMEVPVVVANDQVADSSSLRLRHSVPKYTEVPESLWALDARRSLRSHRARLMPGVCFKCRQAFYDRIDIEVLGIL